MNPRLFAKGIPLRIADFFAVGDSRLDTLILPEGVEEIGMGAFSFSPNLRAVHLPKSLRIIGAGAFSGCAALEKLFIPAEIAEVRGSFSADPKLNWIEVDESFGLRLDDAFLIRGDTLLRAFPSLLSGNEVCIPEGIRRISGGAFARCTSLERIHLPKSLRIIEGGVFAGCSKMSEIAIPEGVAEIGSEAFAGLPLRELVLPDSITKIGEWCCDGCSSLRRVTLPDELCYPVNAFPPSCRKEQRRNAEISFDPEFLAGAREIGPYAFAGMREVEEITIPESVTRIGEGAFQNIPSLKIIHLPRNLKTIERNAFAFLPELEEIDLPDAITEIPQGCFWNCGSLRHIKFPESLRLINRYAFRDCTALEQLRLPCGLISLVSGAFQGCSSLREIVFPESLRLIGSGDYLNPEMEFPGTFEGCVSLSEVQLPEKLDLLNDHTFRDCNGLKRVKMPGWIGCCGKNIFAGCPNVQIVESYRSGVETIPDWVRELQKFRSMKIGFLFALMEEADPFAQALRVKGTLTQRQPVYHDGNWLLVCGAGRANASAGTIRLFREGCRTVVNIGTAGGYKIFDSARVFAPETFYDGDAFLGNQGEHLLDPAGVNFPGAVTSGPPVFTISGFASGSLLPMPALIDNEAYAIATAADALGMKRIFVKVVSDHADTDALPDFRNTLANFADHTDEVGKSLIVQLHKCAKEELPHG